MNRTSLLIGAMALGLAAATQADTRLEFSDESGLSTFSIQGNRIRMDNEDGTYTLFDAGSRELTVVEPGEQRFYRMDAETMKQQGQRISEQMQQMREQMEQQLQSLPEEQREMMRQQMEQMMQSQMPAQDSAPADVSIQRGGAGSVAGVRCDWVAVLADGNPVQRVCLADSSALGMSGGDMKTLRAMFATFADMASSFGGEMDAPAPVQVLERFDGVPVKGTDANGTVEWALRSVDQAELDADRFRVPAGYREFDGFSMEAQ
ncbi:MAG: DUF4412 domain-containing protein [Halofilum sp. (in: g-proteobacteria)]|nr:DUF4412 domain-containing protein [Halofilum sp. (in: g-proteobacteria)]